MSFLPYIPEIDLEDFKRVLKVKEWLWLKRNEARIKVIGLTKEEDYFKQLDNWTKGLPQVDLKLFSVEVKGEVRKLKVKTK